MSGRFGLGKRQKVDVLMPILLHLSTYRDSAAVVAVAATATLHYGNFHNASFPSTSNGKSFTSVVVVFPQSASLYSLLLLLLPIAGSA